MKDKLQMILFVLVMGAILTTALVTIDAITEPYIKANQLKKLQMSVLGVAGIEYTEENREQVFAESIETKPFPDYLQPKDADEDKKLKFYVTSDNQIIFEFKGNGLQGEIHGAIALMDDLDTIKGITIIKQEETPGLGGRIGEAEFLNQFKNKKLFPELKITRQGKASGINEVDGITGATLSCNALEEVLNSESQKYIPAIKEIR
ncbi:MAG: FMN-binding protein [Planctomycetes bacterium]|nr:FMN-binding protein [Planctomycetota bacterium]